MEKPITNVLLCAYNRKTDGLNLVTWKDSMGPYCFTDDIYGSLNYIKLVPDDNGSIPNQRDLEMIYITREEFEYHKNLLESINEVLKDS